MQKGTPSSQCQQLMDSQTSHVLGVWGGVPILVPRKEGLRDRRAQMHRRGVKDGERKAQGQVLKASQEQSPALVKAAQAEVLGWG